MTTNEKILAIENKIRGECEWLMELSFGCEIEALIGNDPMWADYEVGKVLYEHSICNKHKTSRKCNEDCDYDDGFTARFGYEDDGFYTLTFKRDEKYKILGHPTQLSDLLYVIGKLTNRKIILQANGVLAEWIGSTYDTEEKKIIWNYKLDKSFKENLEQSPNLCEFLFNLICK